MEPSNTKPGSGSGGSPGPPLTHPKAAGLEAVIASAVNEALARHGGGGGGGGGGNGELEKRVIAIEGRLGTIEKTMVTGKDLEKELGSVRTELAKVPFETIKWLVAVLGIIAAVSTAIYNIFFKA